MGVPSSGLFVSRELTSGVASVINDIPFATEKFGRTARQNQFTACFELAALFEHQFAAIQVGIGNDMVAGQEPRHPAFSKRACPGSIAECSPQWPGTVSGIIAFLKEKFACLSGEFQRNLLVSQ